MGKKGERESAIRWAGGRSKGEKGVISFRKGKVNVFRPCCWEKGRLVGEEKLGREPERGACPQGKEGGEYHFGHWERRSFVSGEGGQGGTVLVRHEQKKIGAGEGI